MVRIPAETPNIYAYLDYRVWLADWFAARKRANPRFSHRLFARKADQSSPSYLKHIIDGKRNLTARTLASFQKALALPAADAAFFAMLVELEQAADDDARNAAWVRISAVRRFREARRIEGASFEYLSNWYFPAVRELAARPDFLEDPRWISRTLRPRITETQARQAMKTLLSLGLLERDSTGAIALGDASLITPHEVVGLAVHNYHHQMIARADDSITAAEPEERHLLGVTVGIPASLIPTLKDELNRFQAHLLDLCDSAEDPVERVYQLNLHLFPLSAPKAPES